MDAPLSSYFGKPWPNSTTETQPDRFQFSIKLASNDSPLVQNRVQVNTTGNVFDFNLSLLGSPTLEPISVVLYGGPEGKDPTWNATSEVFYLPDNRDDGNSGGKRRSVTKLDNLNGGMLFRNRATNNTFQPLLAYGFYSSHDGFLRNVSRNNTGPLEKYTDFGLNAIIPLTNYQDSEDLFGLMDQMDLRFMFDMREFYKNLTMVEEQVNRARDAEAIFAYWTADEYVIFVRE